ncbi:response regulator transcription factor [Arcobacter ellisii]|uniref:Signal transduction response regulator, OmpR family n=1 Tax=Arcobacter ellisii TaxID=913109 RepID=A0A347U8T9_9BACT|nr:response regulator transcription factor [Arcobacter ellisii]AXX95267.1 signal transduction response regulator, OmpR family [Arcobacter ellisii]RXI30083.1 hypothetical protein CP962_08745 [Arcobacter ellisii]
MIDYISLEKYGKKISVLFVEDDENIVKEMGFLLGDIFDKVDIAIDGKDGLSKYNEYYKSNEEFYDLIITDIQMPNMNGIDLIKNIYKINPLQKVIVLSAYNEKDYLMELINVGISQFILKPIDYNTFLDVIFKISKEIYETKYKKDSKVSLFIKIDDELIWNKELKQLTYKEEILKLTKKELYLVELLLKYPEKTYSNEEIISYLWRDDFESQGDISNLKNIISRLRKKIPLLNVENIYSFGYRLTIKN